MDDDKVDIIKDDSRFLYAEDLVRDGKWSDVTLTIKEVGLFGSIRDMGGKGKPISRIPFYFERTDKIFLCNVTNRKLITAILRTRSRKAMVGKKITLYPAVMAKCLGQENVTCIRVRVPEGTPVRFINKDFLGRDLTK